MCSMVEDVRSNQVRPLLQKSYLIQSGKISENGYFRNILKQIYWITLPTFLGLETSLVKPYNISICGYFLDYLVISTKPACFKVLAYQFS